MRIMPLTVGAIVGHADENHVRIWGRADDKKEESLPVPPRTFGIARIRREDGGNYGSPRFFKMNPNFDMTGVVTFTGLAADTKYIYQIGWFCAEKELEELESIEQWDWDDADQGKFHTASGDPKAEREFIFGSCRYLLKLPGVNKFDGRGEKTFRSVLNQLDDGRGIDKFLMIGDQIYADDLHFISPDKRVDEYYSRYRDAFSQPYIKTLMSRVSTYMTLDDHEIEDNWPANANDKDMMVKYPSAIHAYQVYQMSHSPLLPIDDNGKLLGTPDKFYYTFKDGCGDFFVTDTRTERDPGEDEIISDRQMNDLIGWLGDGSGRVKFVVTSVPFFPDTKKENDDKWSGYKRQRDQIISHIRARRIEKVVFLSGDVHCSMAAELDVSGPGENELKIYSIISSAFYWPYPHKKRRNFQLTGSVASRDDENAYTLGKVSNVYSGDNFSRVRVSNERIEVEVYERKGDLMHAIEFVF